MCGIAGAVSKPGQLDFARVPFVLERLEHRGPDDTGWLLASQDNVRIGSEWQRDGHDPSGELVLLHRRLSIIDLTQMGWQPMSTEDKRFWIVFNGEIYNFVELRTELQALGYQFHSRSDTEVLLAAYAHWGIAALRRLIGMFAFAILDMRRRALLLVRDFFGIKPLYYSADRKGLKFASEIKALLAFDSSSREINPEKLYLYLRFGLCDDGPDTMFADIKQLPAGHYLEVSLDDFAKLRLVRYWQPASDERIEISFDDAAKRLRELFLRNISLHLRSDVPVGIALSGGIDSSSILAAMRSVAPQLELHAFSHIAEDKTINEERWIDLAAQTAGAQLHKVQPSAGGLLEDFDSLTYAQDQPFGSTSLYAQYCVFREAQKAGVKVMLDGQGADEVLGGYRFYMAARLASLVRQSRWKEASNFIANCSRLPGMSVNWLALRTMDYLLPSSLQVPMRMAIGKEFVPDWLDAGWFRERGVRPASLNGSHSKDFLRENLCRTLTQTTLPGLLRYEDRNSMAFSIESRVPFLTPELVQFLLSLPEDYIIARNGASKAVFRTAMRGLVPEQILERRDKIGFATPEENWLRTLKPWVERVLEGEAAATLPCLRVRRARAHWDSVIAGRKPWTPYIWRWLNLIQWTSRFQVAWT
jgi:asparagine synthase (glutamine-hydrolysing)